VPTIQNAILSEDDVVIISGKSTCLVFDSDLNTFLSDRALPILTQPGPAAHHYDKVGMIDHDIHNVLRIAIHL
jgi:hypothetical protein